MNYVIKKVLNSSVVLVSDHENNEFILLGKGIGYGKRLVKAQIKVLQIRYLFLWKTQSLNSLKN